LITDPFKTLHPFSFQYFDEANRDYLSSELYLRNNPIYHYNSFIFGSSRCCGFNTYHWKHYLPENTRQYLFQAWAESLTGIEQKIDYIDKNGNDIDNAIVMLDIPFSFSEEQLSQKVLFIKHYKFSKQSKLAFQAALFYGFAQKPSKWASSIKAYLHPVIAVFPADTISNDWGTRNRYAEFSVQPQKDSLSNCSATNKAAFLQQIDHFSDADLQVSEPLINEMFLRKLTHIKEVFDRHQTDYRIVISPGYCYTHPAINPKDLYLLREIFGDDKVFDYSGKNNITMDCYNFSDPNHFGLSVGWQIIEDMYNKP
jgi:hypothetical protein